MASGRDAWGIEVGANAIKAIRLVQQEGQVKLADYEVIPFKKILTTPDLNVDEAIQLGLDQLLSKHNLGKSEVVVSVAGHLAFARFAKLPPVEPKKIPDIVKFEAVQQVPFPLEQVEWDYQVFTEPDSPDVEVGIFAITKERVANILSNYRKVGIPVMGLTLSPVAVYNAMAYDLDLSEQPEGLIIIDIGTVSTDIIIADGGDLWLRTLQIGGNNFTEALVRAFKLSFPKAEKLKREAATSKYARQIFQAMRPVFSDLVQEVQRSLGYYQSLNRDAKLTQVYGIGSTFRLPGLQKFLKQQLQMEVIRPNGFKKINAEGTGAADFADNAVNLVTAYGLAVQGLGLERIEANVLPRPMLRQRLWKAKQPIFAATAACMVLGVAAAGARLWVDHASFQSGAGAGKAQTVINQARTYSTKWNELATQQNPWPRIDSVRRVLDYRDLWSKVLDDVTTAALSVNPQPELLEGDYRKITAIPREERRRLYIETVRAGYGGADLAPISGTAPAAASPMMNMGGAWDPETGTFMGGAPGMFGGEEFGMGMPSGGSAPTSSVAGEARPPTEPRFFTIKVTGWTSHSAAATLVDQFITWLQKNAERADRPYKIVADKSQMTVVRKFAQGTQPQQQQQLDLANASLTDVRVLYPQRPTFNESQANDSNFEVTFKIELLPPDKARAAQAPQKPAAPAGVDKPADQPTTPAPAEKPAPAAMLTAPAPALAQLDKRQAAASPELPQ